MHKIGADIPENAVKKRKNVIANASKALNNALKALFNTNSV
jgi:hypothetical protein